MHNSKKVFAFSILIPLFDILILVFSFLLTISFDCYAAPSYLWCIVKQAEGEIYVYTLFVSELHMNGARGDITCVLMLQVAS